MAEEHDMTVQELKALESTAPQKTGLPLPAGETICF
jgi:hypothetical protein